MTTRARRFSRPRGPIPYASILRFPLLRLARPQPCRGCHHTAAVALSRACMANLHRAAHSVKRPPLALLLAAVRRRGARVRQHEHHQPSYPTSRRPPELYLTAVGNYSTLAATRVLTTRTFRLGRMGRAGAMDRLDRSKSAVLDGCNRDYGGRRHLRIARYRVGPRNSN